jgi:hypothetical protein
MRLTAQELRKRYAFDYRVVRELDGPVLTVRAFGSTRDLETNTNPIESTDSAEQATRYRIDYHVRTLIGRGQWQPVTSIGFDLAVENYPTGEPANWIISDHIPYSPHFRKGSPVCTGEMWSDAGGRLLFAHLVLHVARLLNWDEVARGGGYVGWNLDAIEYHRQHFAGRPLDTSLRLPPLPAHLTHGESVEDGLFELGAGSATGGDDDFFRSCGPRPAADSDDMFTRVRHVGGS